MKHLKSVLMLVAVVLLVTGCGKKDTQAQQGEADTAKANKAITNMNQSMFSKMNASTPGTVAPPATTNPPAQSTAASPAPAASAATSTATQTAVNPPPKP